MVRHAAAAILCAALFLDGAPPAAAAILVKTNNADALNLATSWTNNVVPGAADVAQWDSTVSDVNNTTNVLGANLSWAGLKVLNPAAAITILTNAGGSTLTLGTSGVDMSGATVDLTMSNNVTLLGNAVQTWNVASGRTLSLQGAFTRSGGAALNFNGSGTVNIAAGTASSLLAYALVGGTDVGALDASKNLSTVASVITYISNPATGVPSSQYMDMTSPIGATGNDWYTSGSTTYYPRALRFNMPQGSRNYWQLFGHNLILLNGNSGANTILVTTNVGACDVILTGDGSAGASIGMRQTSSGSEFIFDQENTLGSLYINLGFSVKTASLTSNMVTKRGAGRLVVNTDLWYAGPTRVLEGELQLNGANRDNSVITVNAGATLSGNAVVWNGSVTNAGTLWPGNGVAGSMTVSNSLTLNAGSSLKFYNASLATTNTTALLNVMGSLTVAGPVSVSILAGQAAVGQYPLIKWTNNLASVFANFALAAMPPHVMGYLSNNATAFTIDLVVTNVVDPLRWAAGSGTWSVNGGNWVDTTGASTTYQETNGVGDTVLFEDTQSGASPLTISLSTALKPSATTISSSKDYTFSGTGGIGGSGGLTKSGTGTLMLATTNAYTGTTVLNGGTLALPALTNLGLGAITLNGGTLRSGNADDISVRTVTLAGPSTIDVGANNVTYANPIGNNGAGGLTKAGAGSLTLTGTNKFAGNTIVSQGTLALAANTYISNSAAIMVNSGATLDAGTSGVGLSLIGGAGQILGGAGTVSGSVISSNGIITPGTNGVAATLTFANNLQLDGGFLNLDLSTNAGQSDLVIVSGSLTLAGGTVQLNVTGTLTNGSYMLIQYGTLGSGPGSSATLTLTGYAQTGKSLALSDATAGEIDLVVADSASDNIFWSGAGSSWDTAGSLNWSLAGNPWSYTNGDFVTFDDTGAANPTVNLQTALTPGSVVVNNQTTTYTFADGTGIGGGKISGGTSIVKQGSGTLIVATANNNFGPTDLQNGTLQIGNGGTLGDLGSGNVTNNGVLAFLQADSHTVSGVISGGGSVTQQGSGVVTLAANNTYTGPTTIGSSGSLQVGTGGAAGSLGSGAITNDGTLIYDKSGTLTVGNIKTGPANQGALSFTGPAAVTLNNGNTYINNTTINNGVVKLAAADSIPSAATVPGSTGWVVLDGGSSAAGTLDVNGLNINVNALSGTNNTVNGKILNSSVGHTNTLTINGTATAVFSGSILDNAGTGGGVAVVVEGGASQTFDVQSATGNTYTGGTVISNATVTLTAGSTIGTPVGLGTGAVTLLSNAVLYAVGAPAQSSGPTWSSLNNTISIPAGQTATIYGPQRGAMQGKIVGAGTLNYITAYVRGSINGDWSGFTGQVILSGSSNGGNLGIANTNGFGRLLCTNTGTGPVTLYNTVGGTPTIPIGELQDDGTAYLESTSSGNAGGAAANFAIGGLNTSTTFGGGIIDTVGIIKVGTGTLTLTNAVLTYSGTTTVSNGVLALGADSLPNFTNSTPITLAVPGILDVSAAGTLTLGAVSTNQVIQGNGTLRGSLAAAAGATVLPGRANAIGTLTVTGDANLAGNLVMELNRTNAPATNDLLVAQTIEMGGTLTVTNLGPDLHTGDTFRLLSVPATGAFAVTNLPVTTAGGAITYVWTNKLAIDGTIQVLVGVPNITFITNPPAITNFSLAGGNIIISGTNGQAGATCYLLASTNLTTPRTQWKTVATNVLSGSVYSFTNFNAVTPGSAEQFYILSSTNYNP